MATPPTFVSGAVLTAAQMNLIGLFKIGSVALAATTNVNNVFTSDYTNYRLVIASTVGTDSDVNLRLRVGGVDTSSNDYQRSGQRSDYTNGGPVGTGAASQSSITVGRTATADPGGGIVVDVYNPQTAFRTYFTSQSISAAFLLNAGGYLDLTTQYDGFTLLGSATFAGTVTVYGYRP